MEKIPLQDRLPEGDDAKVCFGCGADNEHGLQIKSYMEEDIGVCHFTPEPYHTAIPGVLSGGIISTVSECHGGWTALGHYLNHHEEVKVKDVLYMPVKLTVDFLKPTPINQELVFRGQVVAEGEKSATVEVKLYAGDTVTARADVVAVRVQG